MNKSFDCNMKLCIVLLSICALALGGIIPKFNNRIINGRDVNIEDFPYQISLRYGDEHFCGGAILNKDTILTAAHCVYQMDPTFYTIRAGSKYNSQGEVYEISSINIHPKFSMSNVFNYDISVIKLARPLTFSDKIQPIELQPEDTPVPVGTTATVSGWGETYSFAGSPVLRAVEMNVITFAECRSRYEQYYEITNNNVCVLMPNQGACFGDSGGPLVANGRVVGTVSGGLECASTYFPSVFSNVTNLRYFIDQYL